MTQVLLNSRLFQPKPTKTGQNDPNPSKIKTKLVKINNFPSWP